MKQKNHGVALLIAPEQERIMRTVGVYTGLLMWMLAPAMVAAPKKVSFSQPPRSVDVYDFVEITVNVEGPDASNPFTDATLRGSFGKVNRKSTRLNSSHTVISYAVFCLKKKKKKNTTSR